MAVARQLGEQGLETIVIEQETDYGQGISSRNSEVIHAGLYYRQDSLKAKLCVAGRDMLYDYCARRKVPHRQVGKWVVAGSSGQLPRLNSIYQRALSNGCHEVYLMPGEQAREQEPELKARQVLVSPRTGIVDSHALMTAILGDFEAAGGQVVFKTPVENIKPVSNGFDVSLGGAEPSVVRARVVVNSAGLNAVKLAQSQGPVPKACYAKGNYFSLSGKTPFRRLIYPVPEDGGLGVHLTLDLRGRAKFGPDVQWVDAPEYSVDAARTTAFVRAIQSYWPACEEGRLQPDYAGVRPKLGTSAQFSDDFLIHDETRHGHRGLVHLLGIESPGLTCCLSLAEYVVKKVLRV
ncbi:MAG: NAD(P)/FAD-dependent oxidoreductase [Limnobacter sp.]|nr:NAD(P)/FAD-dependent oxidoreductase [Limnobacter sp.]